MSRSPWTSLSYRGLVTCHRTVKWSIPGIIMALLKGEKETRCHQRTNSPDWSLHIFSVALIKVDWLCLSQKLHTDRFHLRDHQPRWVTERKGDVCMKIEFNSRRLGLVHQHGCYSFVLVQQYGCHDVTWKGSIHCFNNSYLKMWLKNCTKT